LYFVWIIIQRRAVVNFLLFQHVVEEHCEHSSSSLICFSSGSPFESLINLRAIFPNSVSLFIICLLVQNLAWIIFHIGRRH
jgi:hypothetical protein